MSIEYLEPDRPYIAKQFNGPIITAFFKAVYNFFHTFLDHHMNYFKTLSIETADTAHLRFIGNIMGLQLFQLFSDPSGGMYLVFTDAAFGTDEYDYNNGWAELYRQYQDGDGVFGTGNEQEYPVVLTTNQYRAILEAVSQVASASVDSIFMIDLLAHVYLESTDYNISYNAGYTDVVNVVLGESVPQLRVAILQHMYDRLLQGGTVTVLVTHI
jgi:hypothetical protein